MAMTMMRTRMCFLAVRPGGTAAAALALLVLGAATASGATTSGMLYPKAPVPGNGNRADVTLEIEVNGCTPMVNCPSDTDTSYVIEKRTPLVSRFDVTYDDAANLVTFRRLTMVGSDLSFYLNALVQPVVEEVWIELDPAWPDPSGTRDPGTGAFTVTAHVIVHGMMRQTPGGAQTPFDKQTNLDLTGTLQPTQTLGDVGWYALTDGHGVIAPMWDMFYGYRFWIYGDVYLDQESVFYTLPERAEYNGDNREEVGVFRNGMWFLQYSPDYSGLDAVVAFGSPTPGNDEPHIGEFSCLGAGGGGRPDTITDLITLRKPFSTWSVTVGPSWDSTPDLVLTVGTTNHKFLPTRRLDSNVDGCSDIGAFRNGCFSVYESPYYSGVGTSVCVGQASDTPLVADLNGDGMTDFGVRNNAQAAFYFKDSPDYDAIDHSVVFGNSTDTPILGEINGDGMADLGVYRASSSTFFFTCSPGYTGICLNKTHGNPAFGDLPILADVDGDGKTDLGIWRNSVARWFFRCSNNNYTTSCMSKSFGTAGDQPIYGTKGQ